MEFSGSNHVNSKLHVHLQNDYEQFLNSFEKPAQIYRVLRERYLEQPIFLNRNLSYMRNKDDNPRTVTSRSKFNLAEVLDSCLCETEVSESESDSDSCLKIEINNFSLTNQSDHQFTEEPVWEISVELKRPILSPAKFEIIPMKIFSFPSQNISGSDREDILSPLITLPFKQIKSHSVALLQQTSIIFSIKRLNSINSTDQLDSCGNQSETSLQHSNSPTIKSSGKHKINTHRQYHTPSLSSKQKAKHELNFSSGKEKVHKLKTNNKKRKQNEPNSIQKRAKISTPSCANNRTRSIHQKFVDTTANISPNTSCIGKRNKSQKQISKLNEGFSKQKTDILLERIRNLCPKFFNNVVELRLFSNKSEYCLLKKGKYEIYFSLPENEDSVGTDTPKFIRYSLCFNLYWTHNAPTTRNLTDYSTPLKRAIHKHLKLNSKPAPSRLFTEGQTNTPTIYNFIYESNTYQQTQQNSRFECPLCSIICPRDFSLLQHLNSTHPRLDFKYIPSDNLTVVDVRVNNEYDGSFSGDPKELGRHGVALWRYGPIRRKPYNSIIHLSPCGVGRKEDIAKFIASYDNDCQQLLGMDRVFFHSRTCHPILPSEINSDSEDDNTEWLLSQTKKLINDFTDVNRQEKEIMKLWNIHMIQFKVVGDCHMAEACIAFANTHAKIIREKSLTNNFLAHLVQLCDQGLITLDQIQDSLSIINELSYS